MIVAGFGCRSTATIDSFRSALAQHPQTADAFATLTGKIGQLCDFAEGQGVGLIAVPPEALARQTTLTQSTTVRASHDTGSVAEATALAAAGPNARLLGPRTISQDRLATCALAIGESS